MKFLLLSIALAVLFWLLRATLRRTHRPPAIDPTAALQPTSACAQCGLHLPRDEALPGRGGVFCSTAHRTTFELAHPDQ